MITLADEKPARYIVVRAVAIGTTPDESPKAVMIKKYFFDEKGIFLERSREEFEFIGSSLFDLRNELSKMRENLFRNVILETEKGEILGLWEPIPKGDLKFHPGMKPRLYEEEMG